MAGNFDDTKEKEEDFGAMDEFDLDAELDGLTFFLKEMGVELEDEAETGQEPEKETGDEVTGNVSFDFSKEDAVSRDILESFLFDIDGIEEEPGSRATEEKKQATRETEMYEMGADQPGAYDRSRSSKARVVSDTKEDAAGGRGDADHSDDAKVSNAMDFAGIAEDTEYAGTADTIDFAGGSDEYDVSAADAMTFAGAADDLDDVTYAEAMDFAGIAEDMEDTGDEESVDFTGIVDDSDYADIANDMDFAGDADIENDADDAEDTKDAGSSPKERKKVEKEVDRVLRKTFGKPFSWKREVISWIAMFAIAFALAFVIDNYLIVNATVPTGSMQNTIMAGDRMIGWRLSYLFSEPERGDIIIFEYPDDPEEIYVKRIIGLPGETVTISDGKIYINDSTEPLEEEYLPEEWVWKNDGYTFVVPEDSYLCLGDNRNNSHDARSWTNTYVTKDAILGQAILIYWPMEDFEWLN